MQFEIETVLTIAIATGTSIAYFHTRLDTIKSQIESSMARDWVKFQESLNKDLRVIESDVSSLKSAHGDLFKRYKARGVEFRTRFKEIQQKYIKLKSETEGICRLIFNLSKDTETLFTSTQISPPDRKPSDYKEFRSSIPSPDFDTFRGDEEMEDSAFLDYKDPE